jgi:hypothetical protein
LLYGEEVVEGQFAPVGSAYPFFEGHKGTEINRQWAIGIRQLANTPANKAKKAN